MDGEDVVPLYLESLSNVVCPVSPLSVLCVDDDGFAREALRSLFAKANEQHEVYDVTIVTSAVEALAALSPEPDSGVQHLVQHIVLLDIVLDESERGS